jgi:hypothetical protein
MKRIALFYLLFISFVACAQKKTVPESLLGIKDVVVRIDSALLFVPKWEPQDSMPENPFSMTSDDMQRAYDQANTTWEQFKSLCDQEEYKEALTFYYAYNDELKQPNSGDFLLHLRHSTYRYLFFSEVLRPLLHEYWGEPSATEEYVKVLQLEKAFEDLTKREYDDGSCYVPEVYPLVLMELGLSLATTGQIDEARELFYDIINSVYYITGSNLEANFVASQYAAGLYLVDGQKENAIANWNLFKNALESDSANYDEEELELYLKKIDDEIRQIQ